MIFSIFAFYAFDAETWRFVHIMKVMKRNFEILAGFSAMTSDRQFFNVIQYL